jgi:hypothetical protein
MNIRMKIKSIIIIFAIIITLTGIYIIIEADRLFNVNKNVIQMKGTVIYVDLEGGFYGIIGDDGNKYLPINLPQEYKISGLKIYFKARIRSDIATTAMWGTPIEILEIEAIE